MAEPRWISITLDDAKFMVKEDWTDGGWYFVKPYCKLDMNNLIIEYYRYKNDQLLYTIVQVDIRKRKRRVRRRTIQEGIKRWTEWEPIN